MPTRDAGSLLCVLAPREMGWHGPAVQKAEQLFSVFKAFFCQAGEGSGCWPQPVPPHRLCRRNWVRQILSLTLPGWLCWGINYCTNTGSTWVTPAFHCLSQLPALTPSSEPLVSPAVLTALQGTGGTIPLPPASAAPGFAEHLSRDSAPRTQTELRKSTAKQVSASSTSGR